MTEFQYLNGGNSEAQDKLATAFLLNQVSLGKASTGVLTGLVVSANGTPNNTVLVGAGAGVVQAAILDGADILVNDTTKTLDVLTANPIGALPRRDIIAFDTATTSIGAIIGTPNASPADPTVPTSAIPLARISHPGSGTQTTITSGIITDLRVHTALAGAPVVVANNTERDLLPLVDGQTVFRLDTHTTQTYRNGAWDGGSASCSFGTGWTFASTSADTPTVLKRGGVVHLRGRFKRTSGTGAAAFTVPAGYRPDVVAGFANVYTIVPSQNGGGAIGPTFTFSIDPTTGVASVVQLGTSPTWDSSTWIFVSMTYHAAL